MVCELGWVVDQYVLPKRLWQSEGRKELLFTKLQITQKSLVFQLLQMVEYQPWDSLQRLLRWEHQRVGVFTVCLFYNSPNNHTAHIFNVL